MKISMSQRISMFEMIRWGIAKKTFEYHCTAAINTMFTFTRKKDMFFENSSMNMLLVNKLLTNVSSIRLWI